MKILLIYPPSRTIKGQSKMLSPPLGLAYIAAVLEANGYSVRVLDCTAEGFDEVGTYGDGVIGYGLPAEKILSSVVDYAPDVVGISCLFTVFAPIVEFLADSIKGRLPHSTVVLGGTHSTVCADELVRRPGVDFVVRGEGEYSFLKLVQHLDGESNRTQCTSESREPTLGQIPGITWEESGRILSTPQEYIEDLDALPRPARHLLEMELYTRRGLMQGLPKGKTCHDNYHIQRLSGEVCLLFHPLSMGIPL